MKLCLSKRNYSKKLEQHKMLYYTSVSRSKKCFVNLIFLYASAASVRGAEYVDCGSKYAILHSVAVSNCSDTDERCIFSKNSTTRIDINFTSLTDFERMTTTIQGTLYGVTLPFFGAEKNACKTGVSCPGKKGQRFAFFNKTFVRKSYPTVDVLVGISLVNEKGDKVLCLNFPARVQ